MMTDGEYGRFGTSVAGVSFDNGTAGQRTS